VRFVVVQLPAFVADWRRLGLTDEDLQALEATLMERPGAGDVMRGTGGLRKVRFAPPTWATGKSGAARVCYAHFPQYRRIYLVTVFKKNEKANLSRIESNVIRSLLKAISDRLAKGDRYV
jgi:hypothetical protein